MALDDDKKTDDQTDDKPEMKDGIPADLADLYDKIDDVVKDDDITDDDKKDDDKKIDDDTNDDDSAKDDDDTGTDDDTSDDTGDTGETGFEVLGWDADTVKQLEELNPEMLEDVKALLNHKVSKDDDTSSEDDTSDTDEPAKKIGEVGKLGSSLTEEQYETLKKEHPEMAEIIKTLDGTVGKLSTALASVSEDEDKRLEETQVKEDKRNFRTINKVLDGMTKDYPIFGDSKKLPVDADGKLDDRNRSVKARSGVWDTATKLLSSGLYESFEEAVDAAVVLYQGKNGENLAMRTVAKELNSRSKQITSRPTKQKTKKAEPKKGSDAYIEKVLGDAMEKAGVDG